jgi:hypothetical protein
VITFQEARGIVAKATGEQAAADGWENDDVYLVALDYGDGPPPFDEPDRLVDKRTGAIREVIGMLGEDPAPNLRAIEVEATTEKAVKKMDIVTKSVDAEVLPVESEHPNGEFELLLSNETRDHDGENLWTGEWKQPLPERIHIDGDHAMSIEKTVGSAVPRIEGTQMIGSGTYASTEYAQMVRQLVKERHIRSLSVTYKETKSKSGAPQRELLNAAFVVVGANPDAKVLSSKSAKTSDDGDDDGKYSAEDLSKIKGRIRAAAGKFGIQIADDDKKKQFGASGDNPEPPPDEIVSDHAQRLHDAAVALGYQCQGRSDADPGEDEGANKSIDPQISNTKSVGSPQESAEGSAAADTTASVAAVSAAADESADEVATQVRARSLAFLTIRHDKD